MNNYFIRKHILFLAIFYLFYYFYPSLANPFIPINILEFGAISLLSVLSIITIFILNKITNIDIRIKSSVQTILVIILAIFLFYKPLNFSKIYNYYPNRIICIFILAVWILSIYIYCKKKNIPAAIPLIIFIPTLIQGILMSFEKTINIYLQYNYLTSILIILGFVGYNIYNKK